MLLSYFTISNYRSIQGEYKIDLSNYTTLIGKNNEGKTNVIRAISLGMEIIRIASTGNKRRILHSQLYSWSEDFPISKQNAKRLKKKVTKLRMDFKLDEHEQNKYYERTDSHNNGSLSVYIEIDEGNQFSIKIPKQGKNTKDLSKTKVKEIASCIVDCFDVQYIPAIRSEDDAYDVISQLIDSELTSIQDTEYQQALDIIEKKQRERLDSLESNIAKPLKMFLPSIKHVHINLLQNNRTSPYRFARRFIDVEIDDGVLTSLSRKGDGVKSLSVIALLSQISSEKSILILVDEPETHLHPEAIRYINTVLNQLSSKNQVIISTHSPIFINRSNISSNIIVENGTASPAKRLEEIRKTLGVICSDNLMYSDYVVIVEGPCDKKVLESYFMQDSKLKEWIENGYLTVRAIGGTRNLKNEVYSLTNYCCNFLIVLDYDQAGREAFDTVKRDEKYLITDSNVVFFKVHGKNPSELEDLFKPEVYQEYLSSKHIDITKNAFKNLSKKWADRIETIYVGGDLSDEEENEIKTKVSELVSERINDALTDAGIEIFEKIKSVLMQEFESMRIEHSKSNNERPNNN